MNRRDFMKISGAAAGLALIPVCNVAVAAALGACARPDHLRPPEYSIDDARTLVSTESTGLGAPVDIAVDQRGLVYVLDYLANQVLVLAPARFLGPPAETLDERRLLYVAMTRANRAAALVMF